MITNDIKIIKDSLKCERSADGRFMDIWTSLGIGITHPGNKSLYVNIQRWRQAKLN